MSRRRPAHLASSHTAGSHLASAPLATPGKRARASSAYRGAAEAPAALSTPSAAASGAPRFHNLDVGLLPPEVHAAEQAETAVSRASSGGGQRLPEELSARFSASLGADLGAVRIHTDSQSASAARAVGAKAYAIGQDIHFAAGQYDPASAAGQHLLAHEVAHTVQQAGGSEMRQNKLEVSAPDDAHEVEADRAAEAMVAGQQATVSTSTDGKVSRFWDEVQELFGWGSEEAESGGISAAANTVAVAADVESDIEVQRARQDLAISQEQLAQAQRAASDAVVHYDQAAKDFHASNPTLDEATQAYDQARRTRDRTDSELASAQVNHEKMQARLEQARQDAEARARAQDIRGEQYE